MSLGRGRRILLGSLLAVGVVAVTAALPTITDWLSDDPGPRTSTQRDELSVERLDSIDQLKTAFNGDVGRVRVYLLLSPT
jgi:hypothetical protein